MTQAYEIIDAHTHVHPTRADAHAFLAFINQRNVPRAGDVTEALATMDRLGIRKTVILPWLFARQIYTNRVQELTKAQKPVSPERVRTQIGAQWSAYNSWAIEAGKRRPGRFAAMVAIDPVLMGETWVRTEVERRLAQGALGLKIVPYAIECHPADDRMAVVWELANARGLPVVSQSGGRAPSDFAYPANFEPVVKGYPKLQLIMAHVGMGAEEEAARLAARYPNLYVDTSYWLGLVGKQGGYTLAGAADLFRRIGIDRVLFGTNYPICDPAEFVQVVNEMPLSEAERRQVFSENYRRVYADWR